MPGAEDGGAVRVCHVQGHGVRGASARRRERGEERRAGVAEPEAGVREGEGGGGGRAGCGREGRCVVQVCLFCRGGGKGEGLVACFLFFVKAALFRVVCVVVWCGVVWFGVCACFFPTAMLSRFVCFVFLS